VRTDSCSQQLRARLPATLCRPQSKAVSRNVPAVSSRLSSTVVSPPSAFVLIMRTVYLCSRMMCRPTAPLARAQLRPTHLSLRPTRLRLRNPMCVYQRCYILRGGLTYHLRLEPLRLQPRFIPPRPGCLLPSMAHLSLLASKAVSTARPSLVVARTLPVSRRRDNVAFTPMSTTMERLTVDK
jgi:hypothetical protein